ncbi:helix-turn-helix domain-containing protein [Stackebrandtia soli]|uniref:helix-turn-helix domain-containing protein n=1 Tax=Stackebrandtia soli TaxID=1892856 RepID=UPI0039E96011
MTSNTNPIYAWLQEPEGLAERLLALREEAGLSGKELAARSGWEQSKVSRLENGKQRPSESDLTSWAAACGKPEAAADLIGIWTRLLASHRDWKHRVKVGGHAAVQTDFVKLTTEATCIRNFSLAFVAGLLQTPDYANAVFQEMAVLHEHPDDDIDAAVAKRLQRQTMLYDTSKTFDIVIDEAALRRNVYGPKIMRGQLDRLSAAIGMSNVDVRILPMRPTKPLGISPQNSFAIYDDVALVETYVGESVHDGEGATKYHQVMNQLMKVSLAGDEARQLIATMAQETT